MYNNKKVAAVITAAGSGSRMRQNITKQFIKLGVMTVLERTIRKVLKSKYIDEIVIVVKSDEKVEVENLVDSLKPCIEVKITLGGSSREESTLNGIKSLSIDTSIVVMHDGARPFIKTDIIDDMIKLNDKHAAIICAVPAVDTIKVITNDNKVESTPERSRLYMVQTPQVFDYDIIVKAYGLYTESNVKVTDDSSLVQMTGTDVFVFNGDYNNFKITTPEDLKLAELLAQEEDFENR